MANYIDPVALSRTWLQWQTNPSTANWQSLQLFIYTSCQHQSNKFYKLSQDQRQDLIMEAFAVTAAKFQRGRCQMDPNKGKPFALLTLIVTRVMYTILAKQKAQNINWNKFIKTMGQEMGIDFNEGYDLPEDEE